MATHSDDKTLIALLESFDAAVHDPNKELVHLYEIREALRTKFGSENGVREALAITESQWSRFGRLCNDKSLAQGCHSVKNVGTLRDASEDELTEVRKIAQVIIKAYMQFLEAKSTVGSS